MSLDPVSAVFVYGTLKTGQCRERCWPRPPREIRRAWTYGELYDTGPYPALFAGQDMVGGQVWIFGAEDMPIVLAELDEVEEYRPGHEATNLYNRVAIECYDQDSQTIHAYTYLYARQYERNLFQRVQPDYSWATRRLAVWPVGADW